MVFVKLSLMPQGVEHNNPPDAIKGIVQRETIFDAARR